ncbi:MAG: sigma-70 family RNA polymerase sigma factor [Saprospiraceae bacterium]|nr:sigma-70 family RNA polymerase sigma factor [Saprospiraceae bacterium]
MKVRKDQLVSIWKKFLVGDRQACREIFYKCYLDLYNYGMRLGFSKEIVEDQIQELFLYLYEHCEDLNSEVNNVLSYLMISLRRRLINMKHFDYTELSADDTLDHFELGIEDIIVHGEDSKSLETVFAKTLDQLPARQREVIYLKYYYNFSIPEIVEVTGISYQVVANMLYRAIKKLRKEEQLRRLLS